MAKCVAATERGSIVAGGNFEQFGVDKKNLETGNIQCLRVNY